MAELRKFGKHDGKDVLEAVLKTDQAEISILNFGCCIRDWRVSVDDRVVGCVLGFEKLEDYVKHSRSHGIIAGRVANRIANGKFFVGGEEFQVDTNESPNTLHGGSKGLGVQVWDMEADGDNALELTYVSPDGEMGFPGEIEFRVRYELSGSTLTCEMWGKPDRKTPINLAQHSYYNLNGGGDVLGHVLEIDAPMYTPTDDALITTGEMLPVGGTHLDFRVPVLVGERDHKLVGIDANLVLNDLHNPEKPVASLWSEDTGLELKIWTEQPGLQVFNAPQMTIGTPGHGGQEYGPFAGLCLEPQNFPDAVNKVDWPSMIYGPQKPYYQRLVMDIAPQF